MGRPTTITHLHQEVKQQCRRASRQTDYSIVLGGRAQHKKGCHYAKVCAMKKVMKKMLPRGTVYRRMIMREVRNRSVAP